MTSAQQGPEREQNKGSRRTESQPDLSAASFSSRAWSAANAVGNAAGSALLSFAKFTGIVIGTNVAHMEEGLKYGGRLELRTDMPNRIDDGVTTRYFENAMVSCIYTVSRSECEGALELRESIDLIRKDMRGGAILYFTDGVLVGGITNATHRWGFHPQEIEIADRLLKRVLEAVERYPSSPV